MKTQRILGLDVGTTSLGWTLVTEQENQPSIIIRTGVRIVPLSSDEETDFQKGKSITINADRTLKRGARRNLQRYKQRRENLIDVLKKVQILSDEDHLPESGKHSTFNLWALRAKAASKKIELKDFARVLLAINKKRGYKSSRKAKDEGDGPAIDGMEVARELYDKRITPGQLVLNRLKEGAKHLPEFYRSDLNQELRAVWEAQKSFYPGILTIELMAQIAGKNKTQTWAILKEPFEIEGVKQTGTATEKRLQQYQWRVDGLHQLLELEHLAIVLQEINGQINSSSGYLGEISDRSKRLYFENLTVGQDLYNQLKANPHTRLKKQVFYRQDYLDEFEKIWETQSGFHGLLTNALKEEIRDIVIFYQRRLKSQKGLIDICELEGRLTKIVVDGKEKEKVIGPRVIPKSMPLFQEFKIWQVLNNLKVTHVESKEVLYPDLEHKELLFDHLNWTDKLEAKDVLRLLGLSSKEYELNHKKGVEGNRTHAVLLKACTQILSISGHDIDLKQYNGLEKKEAVSQVFAALNIDPQVLEFDSDLAHDAFEKQASFQFWHLLYSFEEDPQDPESKDKFFAQLKSKFGFDTPAAKILYGMVLPADYGGLSTRAIKKILPELKAGKDYAEACAFVGYNHSQSITKEENDKRPLDDKLEILRKNSLRNPVVEKILNQMINVVNAIIETYGRPDEIRVELARELKKGALERQEMTNRINTATKRTEQIRARLEGLAPFNKGVRITRNDIIKYKLWEELAGRGYKTLYTNTHVPLERLFTKEFDVEHILPKARIFDDSFSNKTIEAHDANLRKSNDTALEFVQKEHGESSAEVANYKDRIEGLFKNKTISKSKRNKLLFLNSEIPDGFIERDLRNTQYIAKQARQLLRKVVRNVNTTTGMVTSVLREDWQLVNVMQELNWAKYEQLGLTTYELSKDGRHIPKIIDWTKRNDHRHHVMDAIAVAFTRPSHVQYLNFKNARANKSHKKHKSIAGIEEKETELDNNGKRRFKPPMPLNELRKQVKHHLEHTLVSFKAKNKVVTQNTNKTKKAGGYHSKVALTPRDQLHKETVYARRKNYVTKLEKVGSKFDANTIALVADKRYREALLQRLKEFNDDPKKAFTGANALGKNPVFVNDEKSQTVPEKVKLVWLEDRFTIRKEIGPDLKIDKVVDEGVKRILQARLEQFDNNPKEAFANLEKNPIWLTQPLPKEAWKYDNSPRPHELGIALKRVSITGVSNAEPLHVKRDHFGEEVLDAKGNPMPADFVSTGNNHHTAIYQDVDGKLQDAVVSFYEAVMRQNDGLPIIDSTLNEHLGWKFLYSLKQNECFVFPNPETDFDPHAIDLTDQKNYAQISPNLFRVQKFSKLEYGNSAVREYVFRHHLETTLNDSKALKDIAYKSIKSLPHFEGMVKVRIDHIGRIVSVGEG